MNCSMSIPPYLNFSIKIFFGFSKQWHKCFLRSSCPGSDLGNIRRASTKMCVQMKWTKQKKYIKAFRAFINCQDEEFRDARDHMRFLNKGQGAPWVSLFGMCLSGALSDGAWKIINRLTKLKFPTPPSGYDNPKGTRSYLVARSRWADWWLRIFMRTMFDAVAKPINWAMQSYCANCLTNGSCYRSR